MTGTVYVPGTEETDLKKIIMSLQQIGGILSGFTGAWSTWSPTFSMSTVGGTPITAAVSGPGARYLQIGKTTLIALDATISNVGVGNNGQFLFSMPVPLRTSSTIFAATGKEVITLGSLLSVQGNGTTLGQAAIYDNTSLITGGNGTRVQIGGVYESA